MMNFTEEKIALQISKNKNIPFCERQTAELCIFQVINNHARFIHPLIREAGELRKIYPQHPCDSSPLARGRPSMSTPLNRFLQIHHLLRGADTYSNNPKSPVYDSSPHARGKHFIPVIQPGIVRFIPSCEGQISRGHRTNRANMIHPLLRGANSSYRRFPICCCDSSPLAKGKPFC